jgi:hypothetical protein
MSFSPTMPAMMNPAQTSLAALGGSPNRAMPKRTVPTAPMPVQMA